MINRGWGLPRQTGRHVQAVLLKHSSQVGGMVYRNICTEYWLEVLWSEWKTTPRVVENDHAMILWGVQIQIDKLPMANQPDIVLIDKKQKRAVVIMIPSDSDIRKKGTPEESGLALKSPEILRVVI